MAFPKTFDEMTRANYRFDNHATCKGCGEDIEWWFTPSGKEDSHESDAARCRSSRGSLVNLFGSRFVSETLVQSIGEATFLLHCRAYGLSPEMEVAFHPKRKWRLDFLFRDHALAVEIEGGIWQQGRHQRGKGFAEDCAKYNEAALRGITVLRYTTDMVTSGEAIHQVRDYLREHAI